MPRVELIYDPDCPNARQARAQLLRAFSQAGVPARWQEWCRDDPHAPDYAATVSSLGLTFLLHSRYLLNA